MSERRTPPRVARRAAGAMPLLVWMAFAGCARGAPDSGSAEASRVAADIAGRGPYDALQFVENEMVPMRDGIRLATDVYRPSRAYDPVEERFPVLLHRTPYDRTSRGLVDQARWFATNGYVVVVQDTRGLYGSEGEFEKYHAFDSTDGFDTIAWITGLDYVEPRVGMWGTSYGAHTQADAAKLAPPGLETLVLTMGGLSDSWTHKVRNHGVFELGQQLGWAHLQLAASSEDPEIRLRVQSETPADWFPLTPFREGENPLSVAPNFERYYLEMQNTGDDGAYFRGIGRNWAQYYEQTADIPMLHVSGWYDPYARGTIQSYTELSRLKTSPMRLLMGPWTHGGMTRSFAGDVEFGPDAAIPDYPREFHLRWFDRVLKETPSAGAPRPAVRIFVMGGGDGSIDENGRLLHGGSWREADAWPLSGTELVAWYLQPGGGLGPDMPEAEGSRTFTYDPEHPVPTIGGAFSGALRSGGFDQRERTFVELGGRSENGFFGSEMDGRRTADRPDVLVFESGTLAEPVEVVGPIRVRLWVSSTAVDTDITAKLVDAYPTSQALPDGYDLNLTDGVLRLRYREARDRQVLMIPGEVYEIELELFPTANRFETGHRIRLEISSSNYPRFDTNPNTGEPLGRHTRVLTVDNTVYHSPERPSSIQLPIVPAGG